MPGNREYKAERRNCGLRLNLRSPSHWPSIVSHCKKPHNNGQHIANRPRFCGFMDAAALFSTNCINLIALLPYRRYLTQLKSAATISFLPRTDSLTNSPWMAHTVCSLESPHEPTSVRRCDAAPLSIQVLCTAMRSDVADFCRQRVALAERQLGRASTHGDHRRRSAWRKRRSARGGIGADAQ